MENGGFSGGKRRVPTGKTVYSHEEYDPVWAERGCRLVHFAVRNGPNDEAVWAERRCETGRFARSKYAATESQRTERAERQAVRHNASKLAYLQPEAGRAENTRISVLKPKRRMLNNPKFRSLPTATPTPGSTFSAFSFFTLFFFITFAAENQIQTKNYGRLPGGLLQFVKAGDRWQGC